MNRKCCIALLLLFCSIDFILMAQEKNVELCILQTSDVHGCFFPYDYINRKPANGSMARISGYVNSMRDKYGDKVILLDNGDILQGQPTCYYCNYINPDMPNVAAEIINYIGYDAETIGNHDIETGHPVYDKWVKEVECPILGANVIDTQTGKPYFIPYKIFVRENIRIAVIGLTTPAIPNWLDKELWDGMHFDDMTESARQWVEYVKKHEHPDVIIGLFHSGLDGGIETSQYKENAVSRIASDVPGFDLILYGHDHHEAKHCVKNINGDYVLCLNPSSDAHMVSQAMIKVALENGRVVDKDITGQICNIDEFPVDKNFLSHFSHQMDSVASFVNKRIGFFENSIHTRDAYFGSSAFCDFIHNIQLKTTGADISFNAPLAFDASIKAGNVHISDMFNLYKYENQIYVLLMTGKEIHDYLEMSYALWTNTMVSPDDHIMLLKEDVNGNYSFKNLAFNFDSAAGIDYIVDVSKPKGHKVKIQKMTNGMPFDESKWYKVAMNSYRGNGGGELLTKGAGICHDSLKSRIIYTSPRDQRYYLIEEIKSQDILSPVPNNNWHFEPLEWAQPAIVRDKKLLFEKQ